MSGLARVQATFDRCTDERRAAIMPYFVAGFPTWRASRRAIVQAARSGADLIEVGLPFSDPVADGPAIQEASNRSLRSGARVATTLEMVRRLRAGGFETPLIAMTYANVIHGAGYEKSAQRFSSAGFDGGIVPDIPLEESAGYRRAWAGRDMCAVLLAAPTTSDERLARICAASSGFVYIVAAQGTTGARTSVAPEAKALLRRVAAVRDRRPACVGFGVSTPAHVRALVKAGAEGVIVGSALVPIVARGADVGPAVSRLVKAARRQAQ